MKKILITLFLIIALFAFLPQVYAKDAGDKLYLHYYRYDQTYTDWNVWLWQSEPTSLEGLSYNFVEDETDSTYNFGGMVAIIEFNPDLLDATKLGIIIRKGDWQEKDIDADRFITLSSTTGDEHFYFVEGDPLIGSSINDPEGPSKDPKFKRAYFADEQSISFTSTEAIVESTLKVYKNDLEILIDEIELADDAKSGSLTLSENIDYTSTYEIETTYASNNETVTSDVSFEKLYGTEGFNTAFAYDGDLGAIWSETSTTFKLWAPVSAAVALNLYETGTPQSLGGSDNKETYEMTRGAKGVYSITIPGNLHGKYYTYNVTNGTTTNQDIVDPYAKSVGINGLRGVIVDFDSVNPEGWTDDLKPDNIVNQTDAIIYELHVRDLTTSSTWNGSDENRGKYLGLIETGTTYEGLTTGFDHIKELGITHLQILPFFDYGNAIDETKQDDPTYNSFNWGYMPLNFNALEGNYSSDPYDGLERIREFKQVVMAYAEAGIRINMDVVYNHTGESANSNFNLIVPGYYHRFTSTGAYSNGSGTGNETASEHYMMRKFIVDSVSFWADEYQLGGFRFDLMALHDTETMTEVAETLKSMDETIMIYGEPWTGGTSTLPTSEQSGKSTLEDIDGVGAFNDDFRDGVKGSVFSTWMGGFVQGTFNNEKYLKYGITGGIEHVDNPNYTVWHGSPDKTINYVTSHDNHTLHDKLYLSLVESNRLDLLPAMSIQSTGLVLLSEGIPFIHAGDEFMRSKEKADGSFDENSYQSTDAVNQIQWNLKKENYDHYQKIQSLIELRKSESSLRYTDAELINQNLRFVYDETVGVIAYSITDDVNNTTLLVVLNANDNDLTIDLPGGSWSLLFDSFAESSTLDALSYSIKAHGLYVFKADSIIESSAYPTTLSSSNSALIIWLSVAGSVILLGGGGFAVWFFLLRKKKIKV